MKSSKDETHGLLHTYTEHPGTIQFELAEGRNTFQYLDSERSHRKSTCIKYSKSFSKSKDPGVFLCASNHFYTKTRCMYTYSKKNRPHIFRVL